MIRAAILALVLLAAGPAAAIDIGQILESRRLQGFAAGPQDSVVAASAAVAGQPMLAVTRVGRRWGYLALYETPDRVIARFGPFPFGRCGEARPSIDIAGFGPGAWSATFRDCAAGTDPIWLLLPEGAVLSIDPTRPGALTLWAGVAPDPPAIAARWTTAPPRDARYQPLPLAPITIAEAPAIPVLDDAHRAAWLAWRRGGAPEAQRAQSALRALGAAIDRTDWFGTTPPPASIANDAGFWLQQTGGCAEAADALPLLAAALRAEPGRNPARLNRADALARRGACANDGRAIREAAEEYRLYCTAQTPARIPGAIARRIATALSVTRLDAESCRPLVGAHRAIAAGDVAGLSALLREYPDDAMQADAAGAFPLGLAIARRDTAMAEALLRAGGDPDRAGTSEYTYLPLVSAAWNGDVAMVRLLLAHRARVDPVNPRVPPLIAAAQAGREHGATVSFSLLSMMLDARAPVDGADDEGRTALMEAAGADAAPEVIALLVARGAAVNRVSRYGRNAAHAVAPFTEKSGATLDALIAAGVNLDQQDAQGQTPLNRLFAWSGRNPAVVRLLALRILAGGADPRLPDNERRSPLFRAALSGDVMLVEAMLAMPERGAPPTQQDPVPLLRQRLAEAPAAPPRDGCPCAADWRRILDLLGAP